MLQWGNKTGHTVRVAAAAACFVAVAFTSATAFAAGASTRTAAEVIGRWQQAKPAYTGTPYASSPVMYGPGYVAPTLTGSFVSDGLNILNYARFVAGIPDDVVIDQSLEATASHGPVLLAASGFSHKPAQPADMSDSFYNVALSVTTNSSFGYGDDSLADFNLSCLDDSDPMNITALGHRRWALSPKLARTGMGYADGWSTVRAMDKICQSRTTAVDYDTINWPAAGVFPVELMKANTAWSITLNPDRYAWTSGSAGHTVTLRRVRDGKTWTFSASDADTMGEYFNLNEESYGNIRDSRGCTRNNCFIFRPNPASVGAYLEGDVFEVKLSGGITNVADGTPATISYTTQFVSQTGYSVATTTSVSGKSSTKVNRLYSVCGTVTPVNAEPVGGAVTITFKRYYSGYWHTVKTTTAAVSGGVYGYTYKPTRTGSWRVYVRYTGQLVGLNKYTGSSTSKSFKTVY